MNVWIAIAIREEFGNVTMLGVFDSRTLAQDQTAMARERWPNCRTAIVQSQINDTWITEV